ncbi:MAG: CYTH domain-containing protein [Candidatus Komeilibacteria bacterium]
MAISKLTVKITNKTRLQAKIKLLGARLQKREHQIDVYYQKSVKDRPIRIRKNLTRGIASLDYQADKQWSARINDGNMLDVIFQHLRIKEIATLDKMRSTYVYKNFIFDLDEIKSKGSYLTLRSRGMTPKRGHKALTDILADLGLSKQPLIKQDYWQLITQKK